MPDNISANGIFFLRIIITRNIRPENTLNIPAASNKGKTTIEIYDTLRSPFNGKYFIELFKGIFSCFKIQSLYSETKAGKDVERNPHDAK